MVGVGPHGGQAVRARSRLRAGSLKEEAAVADLSGVLWLCLNDSNDSHMSMAHDVHLGTRLVKVLSLWLMALSQQ